MYFEQLLQGNLEMRWCSECKMFEIVIMMKLQFGKASAILPMGVSG